MNNQKTGSTLFQSRGHLLSPQVHGGTIQEINLKSRLLQHRNCSEEPVRMALHSSPGFCCPASRATKIPYHRWIEDEHISHIFTFLSNLLLGWKVEGLLTVQHRLLDSHFFCVTRGSAPGSSPYRHMVSTWSPVTLAIMSLDRSSEGEELPERNFSA